MHTSQYRMVYAFLENTAFGDWVCAYWHGNLPQKELLRRYLGEARLGEAAAWGPAGPHVSITDAQTCSDRAAFDRIVKSITALASPPTIKPKRLRIHRGSYLVVDIDSPELEKASMAIRAATSPLICRSQITDEEWQIAEWRARNAGNAEDLQVLRTARRVYETAGSPVLDCGRYFRVGMLVALTRRKISKAADAATASHDLEHFLSSGEPPWYRQRALLHTTLASGLKPGIDAIDKFEKLWPEVERKFDAIKLEHLAIMSEDPDDIAKVRFWDSVTQTFMEEERPNFKVVKQVSFGFSGESCGTPSDR